MTLRFSGTFEALQKLTALTGVSGEWREREDHYQYRATSSSLDGRATSRRSGQATRAPGGSQARMIPVPVPPGGEGGIFNCVEGSRSEVAKKCRKLARWLEDTIESNYGVLMPAYLKKLVKERPALDQRFRQLIDGFVEKVRADRDPWEQRFAAKFGIVLAAAVLLSEFDLAPWTKKRARKAITAIYKKARARLPFPLTRQQTLSFMCFRNL